MKKKICIILLILFIFIITIYFLYILNYLPHRKYRNEDFNIETYTSKIDQDNDGIDDQTDILNNVRNYIDTKPKYKSKYYANGYPDDGYGVCTDVVTFGLREAGYDLMLLVNEDIKKHPDRYQIKIIDKNIDFRRVSNLKVYFDNNAIALTTDLSNIEEWQGGDIVLFKKHIAIISDNRNKDGIPFILHHASPFQKYYEEDILTSKKDILGHYRIS